MPEDTDGRATPALEVSDEYRAALRYWVLAVGGLGATLLLIIDMFNGISWDGVLFALIGVLGGLWALWMATTRVYVSNQGLIVRRFTAVYQLDYRQIISASIEGRFLSVISIVFHPRLDNGLIDINQVGSMLVPSVVDQEQLVEQIVGRISA
jgi:hypothetical protein